MKACGTVFKYGDNVDTDVIIPARHLAITDPKGSRKATSSWHRKILAAVLQGNMRLWPSKLLGSAV